MWAKGQSSVFLIAGERFQAVMTGGLGSNVGSACQLTMVLVVQGAQLWFGALVRGAFTSGA